MWDSYYAFASGLNVVFWIPHIFNILPNFKLFLLPFSLDLAIWSYSALARELLLLWMGANSTEVSCDSGIKRNWMCTVTHIVIRNRRVLLYKTIVILFRCHFRALGGDSHHYGEKVLSKDWRVSSSHPPASTPPCFCGCCELPGRFPKFIGFGCDYARIFSNACFGASSRVGCERLWVLPELVPCSLPVLGDAPCACGWCPDLRYFLHVGAAHSLEHLHS